MKNSDMQLFETHYKDMVQFDDYLGMDLNVEAPGKVTYTLEVRQHHLTAPDSAHGGVTAALMDAALGVSALSYAVSQGNLCATVEFKINYLMQAKPGNILIATGEVKHTGSRIIVSRADILDKESGKLIATGLGTFTQYPIEKRADVLPVDRY
ncbi:MAG: PaaI family thioesterase [Proteobacteria bacterium]|nr:PaaI family thioesterase [Pseudomonadota bacterium]